MREIIITLITACGGAAVAGIFALLKERKAAKERKKTEDSIIVKKIDALDHKLDEHIREDSEAKASEARARILAFGEETLRGTQHTKEAWSDLLASIDAYEDYCDGHPAYENNRAVETIKYLKSLFQKCLEKNNFL